MQEWKEMHVKKENQLIGSPLLRLAVTFVFLFSITGVLVAQGSETKARSLKSKRSKMEKTNEALAAQKLEEIRYQNEKKLIEKLLEEPEAEAEEEDAVTVVRSAPASDRMTLAEAGASDPFESKITLSPMGGVPFISSDKYDVEGKYSAGFGVDVAVDENISVNVSYSYSKMDIDVPGFNENEQLAFLNALGSYNINGFNSNSALNTKDEPLFEGKQHNVEVAGRYNFFNTRSTVRPFVGGGLNYIRSEYSVNRDNQFNNSILAAGIDPRFSQFGFNSGNGGTTEEIDASSIGGNLQGGANISLMKNVSLMAMAKYIMIFSSSQSNNTPTASAFNFSGLSQPQNGEGTLAAGPGALEGAAKDVSDLNILQMMLAIQVTF
jgi:outer membrane protein W